MESWIRTYTGLKFDPFNPDPAAIVIEDIAHALARQCRFSGHTRDHSSVAQHSVVVSRATQATCPYHCALCGLHGLLHDASEAYIVDIPSPIKRQSDFELYRKLERQVMAAVAGRFKLAEGFDKLKEVKLADARAGCTEARDQMRGLEQFPAYPEWEKAGGPFEWTYRGWSPGWAEKVFLQRYEELVNDGSCGPHG